MTWRELIDYGSRLMENELDEPVRIGKYERDKDGSWKPELVYEVEDLIVFDSNEDGETFLQIK